MTIQKEDEDDCIVRHSGRAQIRGKIRRIWRPRYLELMDNGLVRYFESDENPELSSDQHDLHLVKILPKCTLKVFHARIIDVTTLRDVHVGLPGGTYGFLFRGQRLPIAPLIDGCGGASMQDLPTPRDFLCAVTTLEEAQSWVVALQWATSLHQGDWQEMNDDLCSTASVLGSKYHHTKNPALVVVSLHRKKPEEELLKKKFIRKIVVPKIQSIDVVRNTNMSMQIAYKINLLILLKKTGSSVEERYLLRTRDEINLLLRKLAKEFGNSTKAEVGSLQKKFDSQKTVSYSEYVKSIPGIDSLIRTLAMDEHICNSRPLRTFWSLENFCQQHQWDIHRADSVLKCCQHTPQSADEFVKRWLKMGMYENHSILKEYFYSVLLQKSVGLIGITFLSFLILRPSPLIHVYIKYITVPIDAFILTLFLVGWLGKEVERSQSLSASKNKIVKMSTKSRRIAVNENDFQVSKNAGDPCDDNNSISTEEDITEQTLGDEDNGNEAPPSHSKSILSSPLPQYPDNGGISCWSKPADKIFCVRSASYLRDRIKMPSGPAPFSCRGVDIWLTDNPERHIARHPDVMGGRLEEEDTFLVNFLLPFGNLVAYFGIPSSERIPPILGNLWTKFINGDQQYRDARLKLLPVVVNGPWIVKAAVGPGKSPALLGKVIPLQYYFRSPSKNKKGIYEVDVIITASSIAKGILSVVKGHTKSLTMAMGFIIEAAEEEELPETVLCNFQLHELHLEHCPQLPHVDLNEI